ncbi:MAG: hypothetical protein LBG59_05045 [Candidatus Peribacteria bacterium]|nr:hypothetical protein [Candidatus Peribacteria bacterium]
MNQRRQAVEDYNNMGGGVLHHEIQHQWNNDHENIERGMVMEALQRLNATKAALLDTPEKRQACFDYLRAGYTGQPGWNNFDRENNFVDFNGFANWFSTDARRDEILRTNPRANRSVADFTAAIHSIHREEIGQRMRSRYTAVIDDQNNNYHNRRWLMARFDTFLDLMNRSSVDDFGAAGRSNQHLQNHGIAMESQRRFRIGPGR